MESSAEGGPSTGSWFRLLAVWSLLQVHDDGDPGGHRVLQGMSPMARVKEPRAGTTWRRC